MFNRSYCDVVYCPTCTIVFELDLNALYTITMKIVRDRKLQVKQMAGGALKKWT